jgi:hypothetical protein
MEPKTEYSPMTSYEVLKEVENLTSNNPNDADLGKKVRELITFLYGVKKGKNN